MKIAPDEMWHTWEEGEFFGDNKPHMRVALFKTTMTEKADLFHTLLFSSLYGDEHYEIPTENLMTMTRSAKVGTDAATMSLTIRNSAPIVIGENLDESYDGESGSPTKRELREQGEPGKFTYRRGVATDGGGVNPWGHDADELVDLFLPNVLVRTWEGYGTDGDPLPWDDTKLLLTGTWLIDKVNINTSGTLTIDCRDTAKLLIEQRLYPPIVPANMYPVEFCGPSDSTSTIDIPGITTSSSTPEILGPNIAVHSSENWDSSAAPWYGTNANVYGHKASHAFDGNDTSYWISMRNSSPTANWAFEWLDADTNGEPVNRIRFRPWSGGYKLYVGVMEDGAWQGDATVPYIAGTVGFPNQSNHKYVYTSNMPDGEDWYTVDLPRTYNADKVRITFTNLANFGKISGGDYRAGVYEFEVMGYTPPTSRDDTTPDTEEEITTRLWGNISDYTDMVKLFLAWSGFYWPKESGAWADPLFERDDWGSRGGAVWGDFFYSGAQPVDPPCIDPSYWDNKSVMDAINQVKETLGFVGYVDATGGFVWRPPNIWANGNYITGEGFKHGETYIPTVSEDNVLLDYGVTIDDAALRSEIIVISSEDPTIYGSYSPGFADGEETPSGMEGRTGSNVPGQVVTDLGLLAGQQRVMLVPDYPFGKGYEDEIMARKEVEKFAFLVALWIHWSYRQGKVRIPGNPALDIDDQIRIYESKTSESYIHYILGQTVTLNMDTGTYIADIDTHWLGNGPDSSWHMIVNQIPPDLLAYFCQQGMIEGDICDNDNTGAGEWSDTPPVVPDTPIVLPRTPDDLKVPMPSVPVIDPLPGPDYEDDPPDPLGGDPGRVGSCNNAFMERYWGSKWTVSTFTFNMIGYAGSSSQVVVDRRVLIAFQLLAQIFVANELTILTASGKVAPRRVKNGSTDPNRPWSNHSWGTAMDINHHVLKAGSNPKWSIYNNPNITNAERQKYLNVYRDTSSIRAKDSSGKYTIPVFKWGQYFTNFYDPMHWQVCCTAKDLARGVTNVSLSGLPY